jgi:hypothetical protein
VVSGKRCIFIAFIFHQDVVKKIRSMIDQAMPLRRIGTIDETDGATISIASGIKLHAQRRDCD